MSNQKTTATTSKSVIGIMYATKDMPYKESLEYVIKHAHRSIRLYCMDFVGLKAIHG